MTSARYGRMRLGTCIKSNYGIGCESDILQAADGWCSAKTTCTIANDRSYMDREVGVPCPEDLTSYIELTHQCVTGTSIPCVVDFIFVRTTHFTGYNAYMNR